MPATKRKEIRDKVVSTKVKPSVRKKLDKAAAQRDQTVSEYLNHIIEQHLIVAK